jgi:hypothetical protein
MGCAIRLQRGLIGEALQRLKSHEKGVHPMHPPGGPQWQAPLTRRVRRCKNVAGSVWFRGHHTQTALWFGIEISSETAQLRRQHLAEMLGFPLYLSRFCPA